MDSQTLEADHNGEDQTSNDAEYDDYLNARVSEALEKQRVLETIGFEARSENEIIQETIEKENMLKDIKYAQYRTIIRPVQLYKNMVNLILKNQIIREVGFDILKREQILLSEFDDLLEGIPEEAKNLVQNFIEHHRAIHQSLKDDRIGMDFTTVEILEHALVEDPVAFRSREIAYIASELEFFYRTTKVIV